MITLLGALRHTNPALWEKKIRLAMKAAGGRVPDAAGQLGVAARTLFRWLALPTFADVARVEHGLPRDGVRRGRPPKGSRDPMTAK